MLYSMLTEAAKTRSFQNLGEAALYALLGFMVVFVGIAFLILIVWLVGLIMTKSNGTKTAPAEKQSKQKETKAESVTTSEIAEAFSEETIAVITAALMAYYQKNNPKCEFTVKRIKRI